MWVAIQNYEVHLVHAMNADDVIGCTMKIHKQLTPVLESKRFQSSFTVIVLVRMLFFEPVICYHFVGYDIHLNPTDYADT